MIKIHIFHTGKVRVDTAIPYKEKNPLAITGFLRGNDKKTDLHGNLWNGFVAAPQTKTAFWLRQTMIRASRHIL